MILVIAGAPLTLDSYNHNKFSSAANILAPKLTSRACALRVCSPPAAIAVTQAISQTLICKALRIDSPSHAQMNKQRHKTWSFCLKYYILSKSNKIQRQVGGIFHLWQFLLDQIAHGRRPGIKKWRHVNKWKPWSFQLHCAVKPHFSVTKWKMHLLNTWSEYKSCQTNGENGIIHHQVTNHWTNSTWRWPTRSSFSEQILLL